ncbi:TlyA family RNA methyltransferase [Marisediminicola antarctica]|uniref:TlyA family RNA methyltransferase n=1 Tax=Marisediminicola antarctica TaxID=674079 RepID=UPI00137B06FE|nr:TlyA family RNA methyltransferase [Marisediminicola antarctica]
MAESGWAAQGRLPDGVGESGPGAGQTDLRLDAATAGRGLARSRTHASQLITDGLVTVDGRPVVKASVRVRASQVIEVAGTDHYVSRAAHKLNAALDAFPVRIEGRVALDVGASTGGFTQVLLERGATRVIALDVGHDQLAPDIAGDERVTVIEGYNARFMTAENLATAAGGPVAPEIVVADLSFISLTTVLPAIVGTAGLRSSYVLLVKPQFEVGRTGIREGIVRQAPLRTDAVNGVLWAAWDLGLPTAGVVSSPIAGASGNHEYLVWLDVAAGRSPAEWSDAVTALTEAN